MAGQSLSLLVIEDNPGDRALLQEYLEETCPGVFQLVQTERLAAGLAYLDKQPFDVVLLDLRLPDSQGLQSLLQIRQHAPLIPVIILTGQEDVTLGLEAIRQGAQDYLVKGHFDGPLLVRAIQYAVERRRVDRSLWEKEAQVGLMQEHLPAVLWTTDAQFHFTCHKGAKLSGWPGCPPKEGQRCQLCGFFQKLEAGSEAMAAHRQALQGGHVSFDLEWQGRIYQARVEPMYQANHHHNHIVGTIGMALDVTEHRRMEEELRVAHRIQEGLLPTMAPPLPGFDIGGKSCPARATGGDFYNWLPFPNGSWLVAIGDASGHGFGPAILAAATDSCLRVQTHDGIDLPTMHTATNRVLFDATGGEQFVTLALARLEPAARLLFFSSAGHPPGYLLDSQGKVKMELKASVPMLGIFPLLDRPEVQVIALKPGDVVLFFTDGIVETHPPKGGLFGVERALDVVRSCLMLPALAIAQGLCQCVQAFAEGFPPHDDLTAVVIKVDPAKEKELPGSAA